MSVTRSISGFFALAAFAGVISNPALATGDEEGGAGCDAIGGLLGSSVYTSLKEALVGHLPRHSV